MPRVIDFVVAGLRSSRPAQLRLADAIYLADDSSCPRCSVIDTLARWPGSLVAVARAGPRGCVAATRGQPPVPLAVRPEAVPGQLMACAVVAYLWAVTGRPLAQLTGSRVVMDGYVVVVSGVLSSEASSPRTSSASGACVSSKPDSAPAR